MNLGERDNADSRARCLDMARLRCPKQASDNV